MDDILKRVRKREEVNESDNTEQAEVKNDDDNKLAKTSQSQIQSIKKSLS